ncbi:hypothetical protein DL98DRAFT_590710 [Cadophora sp. DSE1049]|nr:hypothetical protein DL98DRAFT_590710 [Cadophora sp. DSE1049]
MDVERENENSFAAYDQAMNRYWEACVSYTNAAKRYAGMTLSYALEHPKMQILPAPALPTVPITPVAPSRPQTSREGGCVMPNSLFSAESFSQWQTEQNSATVFKPRQAYVRMGLECRQVIASAKLRIDSARRQIATISRNIEDMKMNADESGAEAGKTSIGDPGAHHSLPLRTKTGVIKRKKLENSDERLLGREKRQHTRLALRPRHM